MRYRTFRNPAIEQALEKSSKPVRDFLRISLKSLDPSNPNVINSGTVDYKPIGQEIRADLWSKDCNKNLYGGNVAIEKRLETKAKIPSI